MPKYKVLVQPSGLLNGQPWPEVGESVELEKSVGDGMVEAGHLEAAKSPAKAAEKKTETRPAAKAGEEKR